MVSRVESAEVGTQNWQFALNVVPRSEMLLVDLNIGGKVKLMSIICMTDNSRTLISNVHDPLFLDTGVPSEDACYTQVADLRLGDPHYLMNVYSSKLGRQIDVRISHQEEF